MIKEKLVFLLIFWALMSKFSFAQEQLKTYSTETFSRENGLPGSSVFGVCRDRQGVLWVGTDNGLAYLEKSRFWKVQDTTIPHTALRIIPGTDSGVVIFGNQPSRVIHAYRKAPSKVIADVRETSIPGGFVLNKPIGDDYYFCTWKNIFRISKGKLQKLCSVRGLGPTSMIASDDNSVFLTSSSGLYQVLDDTIHRIYDFEVSSAIIKSIDDHEILTPDEYLKYEGRTLVEALSITDPTEQNKTLPVKDQSGSIWFAGHHMGLYQIDGNTVYDVGTSIGLPSAQITYIYADGNDIWLSTNETGLVLIKQGGFTHIGQNDGLDNSEINCIAPLSGNRQFVSTKNGLFIHDPKSGLEDQTTLFTQLEPRLSLLRIKDAHEIEGKLTIGTSERLISSNDYFNVRYGVKFEQSDDCFFVGTYDWMLTKCGNDSVRDRFSPQLSGRVTALLHAGERIYGSNISMYYYKNLTTGKHCENKTIGNDSGPYTGLTKTSDGTIWLSSYTTLYKGIEDTPEPVLSEINGQDLLIRDIKADNQDRLWMATQHGLILFYEGTTRLFNESNGLINDDIKILEFNSAKTELWLGTSKGISILDLGSIDNTPNFEYETYASYLRLPDGTKKPIDFARELSSDDNRLRIGIGIKDYFKRYPVSFQYRFSGTDENWYNTSEVIKLPPLSPGDYFLETRASIPGKSWSQPSIHPIYIAFPFWKRWEFITLCSALFIALITLVYTIRYRSLKSKELVKRKIQDQMNALELQALNANMNPHFIFNALNSIQHYLMPLKNREALDYITNLSKLIRLNMQALGKKEVTLSGELNRLKLYIELEKQRLNEKLSFEISCDASSNIDDILVPPMIIQPLVENAIWHGIAPKDGHGIITVSIEEKHGVVFIEIVDNGVGLRASHKKGQPDHESTGTRLIRRIVANRHPDNELKIEELVDEQGQSLGTKATIRLHLNT